MYKKIFLRIYLNKRRINIVNFFRNVIFFILTII
jgi:hypothetical protein